MVSPSRPIEPHELAHSQRLHEERLEKERRDEILRPVERQLAAATLLLERVRSVIDRVMADDRATNGETKIVEELDHFVPEAGTDYEPAGQTMAVLGWKPGDDPDKHVNSKQWLEENGYLKSWVGCGQCDQTFPCHAGVSRCFRLEPKDPWKALSDSIDLVVDLGTAIDEGIEGRIFGKMQRTMQLLSLRARKWLSVQTSARKKREEQLSTEQRRLGASGIHPGVDGRSFWKIWPNVLQAPNGEALFLADLRKLLAAIGTHLVTDTQFEADRSQLLNSFTEEELYEELRERSRISQNLREALDRSADSVQSKYRCGSCWDTGKWDTGIECPACGGTSFSYPERVEDKRMMLAINSDDWAVARVAELRAAGEKARFRIEWTTVEGRRKYGVTIRREDGTIERSADEQRGRP